MEQMEQLCLRCNAPLKNGICPSCGWNPNAGSVGKSEAEQREEQAVNDMRKKLGMPELLASPAPVASAPAAAVASDSDSELRGYLLGMGYNSDAIPSMISANRDAIRASFEKAKAQRANSPAPEVPQVTPPPVGSGW